MDEENVSEALHEIANALNRLGNGSASTPFGGLEALGIKVKDSADVIAASITDLADAIREMKRSAK